MDIYSLIPTVLFALFALGVFVFRKWLIAKVERGVQHNFDQSLEKLRGDIRKSDEAFRSELQSRQSEIARLRDGVLSGRANRQALIDKRRLEAVERIWAATVAYSPYLGVVSMMGTLKLDAVEKEVPKNKKLQEFFQIIGKGVPEGKLPDNVGKLEQPFLSPAAWTYFSAYQSIIGITLAHLKLWEIGTEDVSKFLNISGVTEILKTALPGYAAYIDQYGVAAAPYLLPVLEKKLMEELQQSLSGAEHDQKDIEQSANIMATIAKTMARESALRASQNPAAAEFIHKIDEIPEASVAMTALPA